MSSLHFRGRQLAVARLRRDVAQFVADLDDTLAIGVLDHRNDQAFRCVDGDADVVEFLVDKCVLFRRERAIEVRKRLQRVDGRLHQERQQRDPVRLLLVGLAGIIKFFPVFLDLGNIRLVIVGDVRDVEPCAMGGTVQRYV